MKTLADHKASEPVIIKQVHGDKALRLMEMGLLPGTELHIIRAAPLGFPIEVKLHGYALTLRKAEADCIELI